MERIERPVVGLEHTPISSWLSPFFSRRAGLTRLVSHFARGIFWYGFKRLADTRAGNRQRILSATGSAFPSPIQLCECQPEPVALEPKPPVAPHFRPRFARPEFQCEMSALGVRVYNVRVDDAKLALFVLVSRRNLSRRQIIDHIRAAAPKMTVFLRKHEPPFIAGIYQSGRLKLWEKL